ncbi:NfeD family protein [Anatilimnocola sp. NA78]|uniref:NfeD family protein n=1 Tax=Anatilimnocola sp. NA78 TaxID=3415683 RepID=UPI003CE45A75
MTALFLFFAVVGGTVLICQFVLTLVGLSGGHDLPDDLSVEHGGDFGGHDVSADHGGDIGHDHGHAGEAHVSNWLFGVISFRTLVAASTFFGLGGLAAHEGGLNLASQLGIAVICGLGAMYGVHWIMKLIGRLGEDGTVRIQRAIGQEGTVYVPIPGSKSRAGKIQLRLQNRLMEYAAVTEGTERLATGTKVRVIRVAGDVLEVAPLPTSTPTRSAEVHSA